MILAKFLIFSDSIWHEYFTYSIQNILFEDGYKVLNNDQIILWSYLNMEYYQ